MKKLIRLFLIIFCIFFLLRAMPGNFVPAARRFGRLAAEQLSSWTLQIAGAIDALTGTSQGGSVQDAGSGENGRTDDDTSTQADGSAQEDPSGQESKASAEPDESTGTNNSTETGSSGGSSSGESDSHPGEEGSRGPVTGDDPAGQTDPSEDEEQEIFYYYYTKISREERLLYDAMLALAQNPDADETTEEARLLSMNPSSDEFAQSYTRAYNALVSDHPELFWIAQARVCYQCRYFILPSFGGQYKVILSLSGNKEDDSSGSDSGGGLSLDTYHEEERQLEAAAGAMLGQVDSSLSQAETALRLHDLLIEYAWYNVEAGADDYAHTAYGALVEDSMGNSGGALCDGYALAYEYLLQRAGLTCTMVCGYAGASDEDNEKHAWNLVLLDGDWYEVDCTWDDLDFLLSPSADGYDLLLEALSDEEYMDRIRHYMFNRTTEQMRSFTPGEEYRYVSYNGWVTLLQSSVHIRFSSDESEETRDYVTPLAPTAEGTRYTWEALTGQEPP